MSAEDTARGIAATERAIAAKERLVAAQKAMRETSGSESSADPLVSFFYLLLRDEISAGKLENVMLKVFASEGATTFTNGWLARYAKNIADRLTNER